MSSQALLAAIETTGKDKLALLEQESRKRVHEILAEAEKTAVGERQAAYQEALRPLATERPRQLHQAHMTARKITAAARESIVARLLTQIESRLKTLRQQPGYDDLFRGLLDESVQALGENELTNNNRGFTCLPRLAVDPRDETLAQAHLKTYSMKIEVVAEIESWGGVVLQSGDGRIIVNNTLEARLEKLKPHLGQICNFVYV